MHTYLIGTSSVKGSLEQTFGHVNFNLYTLFWSFSQPIFSQIAHFLSLCQKDICLHMLTVRL